MPSAEIAIARPSFRLRLEPVLSSPLREGAHPDRREPAAPPVYEKSPDRAQGPPAGFTPLEALSDPHVLVYPRSKLPTFEQQFQRFEPMFHTVFYRKYHPLVRDDVKQVGLLAIYKRWCKDPSLFEQTPAFVVTAAIYGVSNWRQKEQKVRARYTPLLEDNHGKVAGLDIGSGPRRATDAIDFRIDLERATDAVMLAFEDHPDYRAIYGVIRDLVSNVPFQESWHSSGLARGTFAQYRKLVSQEFRRQLPGYYPSVQPGRKA